MPQTALKELYLITDRAACKGRPLLDLLEAALMGGARMVQLREKELSARELLELARKARALTAAYKAMLLVSDRADIALLSGADGVHLTSKSYSAREARWLLGHSGVIGASTHSVEEALRAQGSGADFVTFGPVFPTPSKAAYGAPLGLKELERAAQALSIPVYGLGGVKIDNIGLVAAAGARAALISALFSSADPEAAASEMIAAFKSNAEKDFAKRRSNDTA